MYLLLYKNLSKREMQWMIRHAVAVAPLAWIHNATIEGTIPVMANEKMYKNLSDEISFEAEKYLAYVESKIKTTGFRGVNKSLAINKLRVISECCMEMELIGYAKDLLHILEEDIHNDTYVSEPDAIEKDEQLGVDTKVVEEYLLRLAKKPSIH